MYCPRWIRRSLQGPGELAKLMNLMRYLGYMSPGGARPSAVREATDGGTKCRCSWLRRAHRRRWPLRRRYRAPAFGQVVSTLHRLAGPRPGSCSTSEGRTRWARSTRCRHSRTVAMRPRPSHRDRPLHRQRPLRSVRRQAQREGAPLPRRLAAALRDDDGVPHLPQGGAGRRVQAGRVAVDLRSPPPAGLRRPMNRRRPAPSPSTGAHGLPFATISVPVSPFHLLR